MRINDDAGSDTVGVTKHDIGGLARDARQSEKVFKRVGHAALILFVDETASALNGFRFIAKETRGVNIAFKLSRRDFEVIFAAAIFSEQISGHQIDALVSALR